MRRNGGTPAPDAGNNIAVRVGGTQAITLSPGHKLETIHDSRPSTEVQNFIKRLVESIAFAVGIDPAILYAPQELGSAAVRFAIAKSKDVIKHRLQDRTAWADRIYQYIISCEVRAGRLEPCPTADWARVKWITSSGWSIDLGRDANSAMALIQSGLMSADDYCLSTSGKTSEEIFAENLHSIGHNLRRAQDAGIDYYLICPPKAGAAAPAIESGETPEKPAESDDDNLNPET